MRTYAISGSASGMGAATRRRLEAAGHRVIGIDLRDAEVIADLGTAEGRAEAIDAVLHASHGGLEGLVSAAGLAPPTSGGLIARVNYFGAQALLEGLRPALAASATAQVVQFGSNSSTTTPNLPDDLIAAYLDGREEDAVAIIGSVDPVFGPAIAYGGAKLAITRWCRRAAVTEPWVGEGIRLNVIAPGPVDTRHCCERARSTRCTDPLMEAFPVPVPETPQADDLAAWVEFLLSPVARFACGSVVYVDGGTDALTCAPTTGPAPSRCDRLAEAAIQLGHQQA